MSSENPYADYTVDDLLREFLDAEKKIQELTEQQRKKEGKFTKDLKFWKDTREEIRAILADTMTESTTVSHDSLPYSAIKTTKVSRGFSEKKIEEALKDARLDVVTRQRVMDAIKKQCVEEKTYVQVKAVISKKRKTDEEWANELTKGQKKHRNLN